MIKLIKRKKNIISYKNWLILICKSLNSFTKFGLKWPDDSRKESRQCIFGILLSLSPFGKWQGTSCELTWFSGSVVMEMKIFFFYLFSLYRYYLPLETGGTLHLKRLESPSSKNAFVPSGFWEDFLKFGQCFFAILLSSFLGKGSFICTNVNIIEPRMLCAKFGSNWPSWSGDEDENVKCLQTGGQTDGRTTDNRRSEKLTWALPLTQ